MKKSFILYTDSIQFIEWLTDEDAWKLLKACLLYHKDEEVKLPPLPNMAFLMLKAQFDRDKEKYWDEIEKRREAWRLWGLAKASKSYQVLASASDAKHSLANLADNDNVNDTVNVNVTDTSIISQEDKEIQNTKYNKDEWDTYLSNEWFWTLIAKSLIEIWWKPKENTASFQKWVDKTLDANKITRSEKDYDKLKSGLIWFVEHFKVNKSKVPKASLSSNFCLRFNLK